MAEHRDQVLVRATPNWLEGVDQWRERQRPIPSRAEAIRQIVELHTSFPSERRSLSEALSEVERLAKLADAILDKAFVPLDEARRKKRQKRDETLVQLEHLQDDVQTVAGGASQLRRDIESEQPKIAT